MIIDETDLEFYIDKKVIVTYSPKESMHSYLYGGTLKKITLEGIVIWMDQSQDTLELGDRRYYGFYPFSWKDIYNIKPFENQNDKDFWRMN